VKRISRKIPLKNVAAFKSQLLLWAQQFDEITWLDSNNYEQKYTSYDAVLAVDAQTSLKTTVGNAFTELEHYRNSCDDYLFGYLSYDLKNELENLTSTNTDGLKFDDLYFFQPKRLFFIKNDSVEVRYLEPYQNEIDRDLDEIFNQEEPGLQVKPNVKIKKRITKKEYLAKLDTILAHIHRGDIYEMNFCQEFYAENATINPFEVYQRLNKISKPPFATFLKINHHYLLSASPERFVKKQGTTIISQPIKGTAKRLANKKLDQQLALRLERDEKERSENIMIVDLVRNDLSKTALKGTVNVEELCQLYSFKQVHQLISTVRSEVAKETSVIEILKSLFPMGSMTGAPKIAAMQIIEAQEVSKRGLYSGAVGYISPEGDFDFSVVIRSILYNKNNRYLSYSVGGAITSKSNPEQEYQECLLKAIAMKRALKTQNS
tara:strand:+ start:64512 stop:65813 length:1302 start_codon:yes stop_codon:yes gene_type:complete